MVQNAFHVIFRQILNFRVNFLSVLFLTLFQLSVYFAVELLTDWLFDLVDTHNSEGCTVLFKILGTVH